jgi:hypothetical protein
MIYAAKKDSRLLIILNDTLIVQKSRIVQIQGDQGSSRSKLLRTLGNPPEADKRRRWGIIGFPDLLGRLVPS